MELKAKGKPTRARKEFETFSKRWPESELAASAKQTVGDFYFAEGKDQQAFDTYEELIDQYYTSIQDYDIVLKRQFDIAVREMNRLRMKWFFGGYRSPERAVPYLESIIRNAPQWKSAPQMQYLIGQAYQKTKDYEMAIMAYSTVEFRYPNSSFAMKAAFAKIECLKERVHSTPYSVNLREEAQLAVKLFLALYPKSEHLASTRVFSEELRNLDAQHDYDVGKFYEQILHPAQTNSAAIYYTKVIKMYGGTKYADLSAERLKIISASERSIAVPVQRLSIRSRGAMETQRMKTKPLPDRMVDDDEAVEITADRLEYSEELLIGEGNVAFQYEGASLQADRITVNSDTGEIDATGNILMSRDEGSWEGQELLYNYKTGEGTFEESFISFEPAYITAGKTEQISTNEIQMYDVMMSTCSGENPLIYARAEEMRIIDENKPSGAFIKAKAVTFYIGPVPIFYMPVWQRHLGYRVFSFTIGAGGRLGAFVMSRAELHPTEWLTTDMHLDLYSKRGLGLGQDADWITPGGQGGIRTYFINDSDPDDKDFTLAQQALIDSRRYRIKLFHKEQIDDETYLMTQLNWLSDPAVIENFFRNEFQHEANPENYAVAQHSTDQYAVDLRIDRRLNNFYSTVERIPSLSFNWYRSQLGKSALYFESENHFGFYEYLNERNHHLATNHRTARLDTYNQLFLPLRLKKFFNLIPRIGYRATWYSDTKTNASKFRHLFEFGTQSSFKAYKILSDQSGFFGNGLRHTVEPYADYLYRAEPGLQPADLCQFDEIDALDERNEIRFGVRNFLQTKRGINRLANVLDSDIYSSYRFNPASGEKNVGELVADTEMSLTENLFMQGTIGYDWYTHHLSPANIRLIHRTADQSEYRFGYRYRDRDDGSTNRSLFTASALLFPHANWSYEIAIRYDGERDEWEDRKVVLQHIFDCLGMGVGYRCDEDEEHQLWIQCWLTAFPKNSIGL